MTPAGLSGRRNLRTVPPDHHRSVRCADHDDSLLRPSRTRTRKNPGGHVNLGRHLRTVAHYVRPGCGARPGGGRRAPVNSTYFPDRVDSCRMLAGTGLSGDLFSLHGGRAAGLSCRAVRHTTPRGRRIGIRSTAA